MEAGPYKAKFIIPVILFVTGMLLSVPSFPQNIINPHEGDHCGSCHLKDPVLGPDEEMDYNFLAEEIDPTCMICHDKKCCSIGEKHRTHPSGIDEWDRDKFDQPENLPLSSGYITCTTCHFWRKDLEEKAREYKMVRIVNVTERGIDWTVLCLDCHRGY